MLLNFEITNWSCFRQKSEFTMEAGLERNAESTVARIDATSRPLKILPFAAIYGNNASGKTQFINALIFLQDFITEKFKSGNLPVYPFLLDEESAKSPTRFLIQFVVNETVYELDVFLTSKGVESEALYVYNMRTTVKSTLFIRQKGKVLECNWGSSAFRGYAKDREFDTTRMFLTLSAVLDAKGDWRIADVYRWFSTTLCIISPTAHYLGMEDYCAATEVSARAQNYLDRFDTGINRLEARKIPLSVFPSTMLDEVSKVLKPGETIRRVIGDEVYVFRRDSTEKLLATQLFAVHGTSSGKPMPFPMYFESDGTRRMLDLIPAICKLTRPDNQSVFVIDEIDRNLHHLVTRTLLEDFLSSCSHSTRTQLIFTTHDLLLMDQDLCRRDEMWVTDKAPDGSSVLSDFASFKGLRRDSRIRDLYLESRLGGVPRHI